MRSRQALGAATLLLFMLQPHAAPRSPGVHVHGEAELSVTADGPQLEIQLQAPLDSLVGFEHAPRTDKHRDAVRAMAARLRQAHTLFVPTPAAGCSATAVRLTSSSLPADLLGEAASPPGQARRSSAEHSDLEATFTFRCTAPDRLRGLDTALQKAFPGIHSLKVQVVSGRGQKAAVLSRGRTSVQW